MKLSEHQLATIQQFFNIKDYPFDEFTKFMAKQPTVMTKEEMVEENKALADKSRIMMEDINARVEKLELVGNTLEYAIMALGIKGFKHCIKMIDDYGFITHSDMRSNRCNLYLRSQMNFKVRGKGVDLYRDSEIRKFIENNHGQIFVTKYNMG